MKAAVLLFQHQGAIIAITKAAQGGSRHEAERVSTNFAKE